MGHWTWNHCHEMASCWVMLFFPVLVVLAIVSQAVDAVAHQPSYGYQPVYHPDPVYHPEPVYHSEPVYHHDPHHGSGALNVSTHKFVPSSQPDFAYFWDRISKEPKVRNKKVKAQKVPVYQPYPYY